MKTLTPKKISVKEIALTIKGNSAMHHMSMKKYLLNISAVLLLSCAMRAEALEFPLPPPGSSVVGEIQEIRASRGDTLGSIGQRYDIGYVEMAEANPDLDPDRQLGSGTTVVVPSRFILPDAPHSGVVINLSELRLYYYPAGRNVVITMPVGIGREGWETPLGTTFISAKVKNPTWRPTKAVREDAAAQGYYLPSMVPPGPDNPLGAYSMRLGGTTYLIHSTNKPEGVGRRSSAGCMRMYSEDAEYLFNHAPTKTQVHIVDQPYKVGWLNNKLYLEVHSPLQERLVNDGSDNAPLVSELLKIAKQRNYKIDWSSVKEAAEETDGIPVAVGYQAGYSANNYAAASETTASSEAVQSGDLHNEELQPVSFNSEADNNS